ncbi:MAG: hypothetical protein MUO22_04670 [Sedimentisphaerales bacterium]|nr:hypothetical protein [Sedimentisphaerales bacterium]
MKTGKYYLALGVFVVLLFVPVWGEPELPEPDENMLVSRCRPALAGIEQLYVVIVPSGAEPNEVGLSLKELDGKIKSRLDKNGIEAISEYISKGHTSKLVEIPELRVDIEMLRLDSPRKVVYRIQTSLAKEVYLQTEPPLCLKADVWQVEPVMRLVSAERMPKAITREVVEQIDAFISACLTVKEYAGEESDIDNAGKASGTAAQSEAKSVGEVREAEYQYVASKNSGVFHKPQCSSAKRIKSTNLVGYNNRAEAVEAGKRACKRCKP